MAGNDTKNENKKKALDAAIAKLEKDFGKGTVMKLGDPAAQVAVETIPTGSLSLDIALGMGGVPKGRIVEIYGPESSGKTTVALHMISEVQKQRRYCRFYRCRACAGSSICQEYRCRY